MVLSMNSDLKISKLRDICTSITDCDHSTPEFTKSGKFVVRSHNVRNGLLNFSKPSYTTDQDFNKRISRAIPEAGDIIITREAPMGEVGMIPKGLQCCLGQRMVLLKPDDNLIDPYYLLFALQSDYLQKQIQQNDNLGSTVSNLRIPVLKDLLIPLPSLSAQHDAVHILKLIDEKIRLNEGITAELDAMNRLIYDFWFNQYDFPSETGKPYRSSGGQMVYSAELNREIPRGWKVRNLLDLVDWVGGSQPPKSTFIYEQSEGYIRFIQNRDYADNNNLTYIPIRRSNKICNQFDIMMDKYGDAGLTRYGIAGAYNVALSKIQVRLKNGQEFIRKYLESESIYHYLHNACMASTRASLNEEVLSNLYIVEPDENTLDNYERQSKEYLKLILSYRRESTELIRLRNWLLPMLMTGMVRPKL